MNRIGIILRHYSRLPPPRSAQSNPFFLSQPTPSPLPSISIVPPPVHTPRQDPFVVENLRVSLPSSLHSIRVYTFPPGQPLPMRAPTVNEQQDMEKVEPSVVQEIRAPSYAPPHAVYASPRLLTIRRKKMKKHKRRKRYDRDWSKYQKYHREKKLKAEREYERRMKGHLAELRAFSPEKYVEETIAASKKVWQRELAPTGRKLYPHWSRLMTLEELYGLPKSDFIDKRSCIPGDEEAAKIAELRAKYRKEYKKEN